MTIKQQLAVMILSLVVAAFLIVTFPAHAQGVDPVETNGRYVSISNQLVRATQEIAARDGVIAARDATIAARDGVVTARDARIKELLEKCGKPCEDAPKSPEKK